MDEEPIAETSADAARRAEPARPATVAVYLFMLRDAKAGWVKQPHRATREHIERMGGAFLFNSKIDVDAADISEDGVYRPSKAAR
jgi:hypothetical protein